MMLPSVLEVVMKKKLVWGLAVAAALVLPLLAWAGVGSNSGCCPVCPFC